MGLSHKIAALCCLFFLSHCSLNGDNKNNRKGKSSITTAETEETNGSTSDSGDSALSPGASDATAAQGALTPGGQQGAALDPATSARRSRELQLIGSEAQSAADSPVESCMKCHNGSTANDYAGNGLQNPHNFGPSPVIRCSTCHNGNPQGFDPNDPTNPDQDNSHVPTPPDLVFDPNDVNNNAADTQAYFIRLWQSGIDKVGQYCQINSADGSYYKVVDIGTNYGVNDSCDALVAGAQQQYPALALSAKQGTYCQIFRDGNHYRVKNLGTEAGVDDSCQAIADEYKQKNPNREYSYREWTPLEYQQFINPGHLTVVAQDQGCAGCHGTQHGDWVRSDPIATQTGFFSGVQFGTGIQNHYPDNYLDAKTQVTAAEFGYREVTNTHYKDPFDQPIQTGEVKKLYEYPVYFQYQYRNDIYKDNNYDVADLEASVIGYNQVKQDSPLEHALTATIDQACGDCHAGSAGQNNRAGDFRSAGCTSCHMAYGIGGRYWGNDKNIVNDQPDNPDAIAPGEKSHPKYHEISSVYKTDQVTGTKIKGIQDTCAASCHQGSNRTMLQYWGIRLDQNQDVVNDFQYPHNPYDFTDTANDERLFDQDLNNNTFNGRNENQYLAEEDYDNDNRDDTPPDIHHERGMVCIDCHGSYDVHNGTAGDETSGALKSRKEQSSAAACTNCHGTADSYAKTAECYTYDNVKKDCAMDQHENALRHVTKRPRPLVPGEGLGEVVAYDYILKSKGDGKEHYLPQTRDVVVDTGAKNKFTGLPVYNAKASFAMGRFDGNAATGHGPQQDGQNPTGFSHSDNLECATCHASWSNNCIGCHLKSQYNDNNDNFFFSNITGERVVAQFTNADFTYINPTHFYLQVNDNCKVAPGPLGMKMFFRWEDNNNDETRVFTFSDRLGNGSNASGGRDPHAALSLDQMMPHTIRSAPNNQNEGWGGCQKCHNVGSNLQEFNQTWPEYPKFMQDMATQNYEGLDLNLLRDHMGRNTHNNRYKSPYTIHATAGLGSGMYLFNSTGCPVNPFDDFANRQYCLDNNNNAVAPSELFADEGFTDVQYNVDGLVEITGVSNASSMHPMSDGSPCDLRDGALYPTQTGPMGSRLVRRLADPTYPSFILLNNYISADDEVIGAKANSLILGTPPLP